MRDGDLADSPLASTHHTPADDCDTSLDHVAEPLILALQQVAFPVAFADARALLAFVLPLYSAGLDALEGSGHSLTAGACAALAARFNDALDFIAEKSNREARIRIVVTRRRVLQSEPRTLHAIGQEFGVVRATIQSEDQKLRARFQGLRIRADKPEAAREKCRQRRTGARKPPPSAVIDSERKQLWKSLSRSLPSSP